jgi:hypothetical protein
MHLFSLIRKNKFVVLISILAAAIILLTVLIIFLNNSGVSNNNKAIDLTQYKGYAQLKQEITGLSSDPQLANSASFNKVVVKLSVIEDKTVSPKDKYTALTLISNNLEDVYVLTNNHKLYSLPADINSFAKENFPTFYKAMDFATTHCVDETCAQSSQPPEILKIADEIKNSTKDEVVKSILTRDLLNPGYLSNNDINTKVSSYIFVINVLKQDQTLKQAGLNDKLFNELLDFVKKTYPDEYKKINGE